MFLFRRGSVSGRIRGLRARVGGRPAARFSPRLLALEERTLLSQVLVVQNTNDSGAGSLRAQVAEAQSGDTIVFSPRVYGRTIALTGGPIEDDGKSLAIEGPGAGLLTISGDDRSGIFNLLPTDPSAPPFAVSISGLRLADSAGPDSSPSYAINDTNASLTLDDDVIADNRSGGVSVYNAYIIYPYTYVMNVNVTRTAFIDNRSDLAGGALNVAGAVVDIRSSLFKDNVVTSNGGFGVGGALYLTNARDAFTSTTIADSQFLDNTGVDGAGAIENFGGPLTIDSSTFDGNKSSSGGAIEGVWENVYFGFPPPTGAFTVTNSSFADNQVVAESAVDGDGTGGAIALFNINGPISIAGSTFLDNRAEGASNGPVFSGYAAGGAIDAFNTSQQFFRPLPFTIAGSTFIGNQAIGGYNAVSGGEAQGGAIRMGGFLDASVTDSRFLGNAAIGGSGGTGDAFTNFNTTNQFALGGAIENAAFEASISGSSFIGNRAIGGDGGPGQIAGVGEGGAVDNEYTALTISNSTFTFNLAQGGHGGAAAAGSSADGGDGGQALGGAVANNGFLPYGKEVTLSGITFLGNRAIGGAGGAGDGSGTGGAGGDAFGGAVFNAGGLAVSSSQFLGDLAQGGDGGRGGRSGIGGAGGDGDGGGILTSGFGDPTPSSLSVATTTFIGNVAIGGDGGSGISDGTDGQGLGGGIAVLDGLATITKSKFAGNKASTSGDDIYGSYSS